MSEFGDTVYEGGVEDTEDLDPIESLTGDDPDEEEQTGYNPPDRQPRATRYGTTELEEYEGESLDQRLAEEEPDVGSANAGFDDAGDLEDERAGRLVAPDQDGGLSTEADEIAADVGPAGYASSAEEAAVHIVGEDRLDD